MWRFAVAQRRDELLARLPRRSLCLRHRDGHRRVPRPAPPSPLPAVPAGIHGQLGYETPTLVERSGSVGRSTQPRMTAALRGNARLARSPPPVPAALRRTLALPVQDGFRRAEYISRLRSGVKGHFSYRKIAWEMKLAMEELEPDLGV